MQIPRLAALCRKATEERLAPATAVPLLESAHAAGDARLLARCRRFIVRECGAVRRAGGLTQLREFAVAKGLLSDAYHEVEALRHENEEQRREIGELRGR